MNRRHCGGASFEKMMPPCLLAGNPPPKGLNLFFNTIRFLKPEQIFFRLYYKASHCKPDCRPAPEIAERQGKHPFL